jgi:hypothetical protein
MVVMFTTETNKCISKDYLQLKLWTCTVYCTLYNMYDTNVHYIHVQYKCTLMYKTVLQMYKKKCTLT